MIIYFLNTHLSVPEVAPAEIKGDTPQIHFVKSHKSDIQKELGGLISILTGISATNIADIMAGCGFSGRVFEKMFPSGRLLLNDLSQQCANILKFNFDNHLIQNVSAESVEYGSFHPDLIFVDFNNFTLNKWTTWASVFDSVFLKQPQYFLFTDSYCYTFKFTKQSGKDYYEKLNLFLHKKSNNRYWINKVCIFGNAALILCASTFPGHIEYCDYVPVIYNCYPVKMFDL